MTFENYKTKDSVIVVYTGEGKGKTSAGLGLLTRSLGAGWKVAFVQFIKTWDVNEHKFINDILPTYSEKLTFYKGGLGFIDAGELSSEVSRNEHVKAARKTYDYVCNLAKSGEYDLIVCDEINNTVHENLLSVDDLDKLIANRSQKTSLCLTGRYFPEMLIEKVDIVTEMTKIKHHYDDNFLANSGIDY